MAIPVLVPVVVLLQVAGLKIIVLIIMLKKLRWIFVFLVEILQNYVTFFHNNSSSTVAVFGTSVVNEFRGNVAQSLVLSVTSGWLVSVFVSMPVYCD